MALLLFDFRCRDCGEQVEELVQSDQTVIPCRSCGGEASRVISPVRSKLDGTDPGFPDAYDRWARQHEKAGRAEPK